LRTDRVVERTWSSSAGTTQSWCVPRS